MDIKYMHFCLCQWKWGTDFIFHKTNFQNYKKTRKHCKYFCLFNKKFMSKQRIPVSKQSPPSLPPYCQIRGSQSPLCKAGRWGFELCTALFVALFLWVNGWSVHNWCVILLITKSQVYWGLTCGFFATNLIEYHKHPQKQRHNAHKGVKRLTHPYKCILTPVLPWMNNLLISKIYFTEFHNVFVF